MAIARFQREERQADTDRWEGKKRYITQNSTFRRRTGVTTRLTHSIRTGNRQPVVAYIRVGPRARFAGVEVVKEANGDSST